MQRQGFICSTQPSTLSQAQENIMVCIPQELYRFQILYSGSLCYRKEPWQVCTGKIYHISKILCIFKYQTFQPNNFYLNTEKTYNCNIYVCHHKPSPYSPLFCPTVVTPCKHSTFKKKGQHKTKKTKILYLLA